ncbi:hypothetical protein NOC27_1615 [Nitrosococcus oceani AFC27]|nr:hypothetical protein [Nitrosococcus oceani]EDZ68288.1 hypothetical protein NOC27_1615 [Nitrosococcus oceani AFC27]GEM21448.1 hypothetical protein NONS58_28920 [Nitrosococcus oceani]
MPLLQAPNAAALDLTGGAPELNPYFRDLVTRAQDLGVRVIDQRKHFLMLSWRRFYGSK